MNYVSNQLTDLKNGQRTTTLLEGGQFRKLGYQNQAQTTINSNLRSFPTSSYTQIEFVIHYL